MALCQYLAVNTIFKKTNKKTFNLTKINSKHKTNKNPSFKIMDETDKEPLARKKRLEFNQKNYSNKPNRPTLAYRELFLTATIRNISCASC